MNFIKGSYDTPQEALDAVRALEAEGYQAHDIRLVSNATIRDIYKNKTNAKFTASEDYVDGDLAVDERVDHEEDESIWEKIKDFFTVDEDYDRERTDPQDDPLVNYRKDIEAGKIVVIVEGERTGTLSTDEHRADELVEKPDNPSMDPVDRPADLNRNPSHLDEHPGDLDSEDPRF